MRDVIDDHVRARLGQRQRDGLADAGIGAGDERLLAFQDLVDGAGGHDRLRQIFLLQMLAHQLFVRRHGWRGTGRHCGVGCLAHGFNSLLVWLIPYPSIHRR